MSGAKFQYDESGTFFYFMLSFEALVIIPCTYYFYPRNTERREKRDTTVCHCDNCHIKNSRLRAHEPYRKAKERFIKLLLFIGWVLLFLTAYKVAHLQHDYVAYDPFEILQIPPDSSMGEIKKAYRRLSLVYHPDKETGDEKQFMMIAKAYAALTDDEARKNFEMYGNPDGPGATSFGIALPSWIIEKQNSVWVLGLYALVFMVALPVAVCIWWNRSVKYNGDEVLLDTTELYLFFIYKTPSMIFKRVLMVIAASMEFRKTYNSEIIERPSDNVEVPQLIKEIPNLGEKNKEKPLCFVYSIKARALLHAHLARLKLPKNTLDEDRLYIVKKTPNLIYEFVNCASQLTMLALAGRISRMPHLETMENAMKLCACVVQALGPTKNPLLQLPHISEEILHHFTTRKRNIRNIRSLACMKSDDRRAMLRSLNDDQYDDVLNVISNMPIIDVDVKSEVLDDEDSCVITAGAIVTVTASLNRRNMSSLFDKEMDEETTNTVEEKPSSTVNGNGSPKPAKPKVWEKAGKKKKGKGGNKLKKKSSNAVSKASVPAKKQQEEKVNAKASDESGGESDSESDHNSANSVSGDENEPSVEKTEKEDKDVEDKEWDIYEKRLSKKEVLESKSKKSHSVHCPFFPDNKQEFWWVYVSDKKKHSLITAPYLVTNLVSKEKIELKFTAPPRPGIYTYSVIVRSDSYLDCDVLKTIKLDVKEAKEVDLTKLQWDVSEEEEEKDEEESAVEDSDLASDIESDED
ncbi:translocation protein SEC63 homolog isoform X4 [Parasteatoda tepidariorum]|uniref:translocation protein SEC63 homolog isoform X3 n=1 Tax=Parasteatoda tepidariorum TaxID=114398 RepID=UPI001C71F8A9|nr:translocation protein SEC63 homolog isoform X3 [Parasteatoda tepidariorum]